MADVTGPISSLPGSAHRLPAGSMCDEHPERQAVARVQGETDSFGSEMVDMCQECLDAYNYHRLKPQPGSCDWCKKDKPNLHDRRDWEEGMSGPVYSVCDDCIREDNRRLDEELAYQRGENGSGFDPGDDFDDVSEHDAQQDWANNDEDPENR